MNPACQGLPAVGAPGLAERAFALAALLVYSRALLGFIFPADAAGGAVAASSVPYKLAAFLIVYAVTGVLAVRDVRRVAAAFWREKSVALLLLLSAASALWSASPAETLEKTVALTGCALFGAWFSLRFSGAEQLSILGLALAVLLLGSAVAALYLPGQGIMSGLHEGVWRGLFAHKNMLGKFMVIAGVVFFLLPLVRPRYRYLATLAFWCSLFVALMSGSKTAQMTWIALFPALAVYLAMDGRRRRAGVALLSAILAATALGVQLRYNVLAPALARQAALCVEARCRGDRSPCNLLYNAQAAAPPSVELDTGSGRLAMWRLMWAELRERPLLGFGMGGFWLGDDGPSAQVYAHLDWRPPHGHNGYLDLALHLGFAGLAIFVWGVAAALRRVLAAGASGALADDDLARAALLLAILLFNLPSSEMVAPNSVFWVLVVAALIGIRGAPGQRNTAQERDS